jgi:membrane associated rhomboid family serine protease
LLPLKDYNPTRRPAVVTFAIIVACCAVYFLVQPGGRSLALRTTGGGATCNDFEFNLRHAAIPYEIVHQHPLNEQQADALVSAAGCPITKPESAPHKNVVLSIFWSMFLHGGLLHLGGNMLFLWIFGNNIEDRFGRLTYLIFYLAAGIVATATQVGLDPSSGLPMIGASGAIAGVMGAYLVLFPRVRILSLIFVFPVDIRAMWWLGFWFVSQFFVSPSSGVAWAAHVGGFIFGVLVGVVWRASHRAMAPVPRGPW